VVAVIASAGTPAFQDYSFDKTLDHNSLAQELSSQIDTTRTGSDGFQPKTLRCQKRTVPEWAATPEGTRKVLLTAFPRLREDPKQRAQAGRWSRVINLYFQLGYTYTQVAEEMGLTPNTILALNRSIRRVASGQSAAKGGLRVKSGAGRPRKTQVTQVAKVIEIRSVEVSENRALSRAA
jgi:transposase-like protein